MEERKMIIIRPAKDSDLAEIAAIEAQSFSEPWSEEGFRSALSLGGMATIFVACFEEPKADGTTGESSVIAYFVLYGSYGEGELSTTAVHPGYRGHGLGHQMMQAMKKYAVSVGITKIFLEVRPSNEAARALYASEGWMEIGKRPHFYRFPDEDAIVMKWEAEE